MARRLGHAGAEYACLGRNSRHAWRRADIDADQCSAESGHYPAPARNKNAHDVSSHDIEMMYQGEGQ
jgi:hypothetical protein